MKFKHNDGGRRAAGFLGETRDCVCRSIAIATQKPYKEVYDALNAIAKGERVTKKMRRRSSSRTGVYRKTYDKYLRSIGWEWTVTMTIGSGCKVHLRDGELPMGRLIVRVTKHVTAVVDGVIQDNHDCSRDGTRCVCVYGYWSGPSSQGKEIS